ncbi:MAG: 16S rRNA (guanine(527)-N(7))-methyltransferase RsmG [Bacillota bacterium]
MTDFLDYLSQGLREIELNISQEQLTQCLKYHDLLLEWNQKINLTSIEDDQEIAIKHFIDSLICLKHITMSNEDKIIDVGTGAGFPGLPIKILMPGIKLGLLDSLEKRCRFLENIVSALELNQVDVIHGRAEDLGKDPAYREQFSFVTARAVTALPVLAEYCLPFVKIGGYFLALKGPEIDEEVNKGEKAVQTMGGRIQEIKFYQLPLLGDARSLIIIKKVISTPDKYPRKTGVPTKKPIL